MTKHKESRTCRLLGLVVRKRRLAQGLTQAEMARRVPCHPSHVSAVERGADSSVVMMVRFAAALGTTLPNLARSAKV